MDPHSRPSPTGTPRTTDISRQVVGILGGTGPQGRGLAYRLARAGQHVVIGSRDAERAADAAVAVGSGVTGTDNAETADRADIVIVTVPWEGHAATLAPLAGRLAGKLVVDSVNPLGFDAHGPFAVRPPEGSAAQQAAALLPRSRVTAAFHHVSAALLTDPAVEKVETDVMILGDTRTDTDAVAQLVGRVPGMRGVYAGRLRNAHQVEGLVANLISVNRRYRTHSGLHVTGL